MPNGFFDQVNYSSLRQPRQQARGQIRHSLHPTRRFTAFEHWPDGTRRPKSNQEAVQFRRAHTWIDFDQVEEIARAQRDFSEISMFGCDGFKRRGDPPSSW